MHHIPCSHTIEERLLSFTEIYTCKPRVRPPASAVSSLPPRDSNFLETGFVRTTATATAWPDVTGPSAQDPGPVSELEDNLNLIGEEAFFSLYFFWGTSTHNRSLTTTYPTNTFGRYTYILTYIPHHFSHITHHPPQTRPVHVDGCD